MILTLTTTHHPATDLGFLLHKNPQRVHTVELAFGVARVFFPEATESTCTAVLMVDVDPMRLARRNPADAAAEQYVNDRPYVVSSFVSVAIAKVFGTALSGRSKERAELAATPIPLRAVMPVVPARGGAQLIERLFAPLGYTVGVARHPLEPTMPAWSDSPYYRVSLEAECTLSTLLRHLYLMIPVLDDKKHYWVGEAEIEKLLHRGEGWLVDHPDRELILRRALKGRRPLARRALERLTGDEAPAEEERQRRSDAEERSLEAPLRLNDLRLDTVAEALHRAGARSVLDLGCGEGKLLARLLKDGQFERIVGLDASVRALETARRRLHLADASPKVLERIELLHGALTYRDDRLSGYDAAALVEVIEHLDPPRLEAMERVVFAHARPRLVVVTTPNREYNAKFDMPADALRHRDHRFEWTREECRAWGRRVGEQHGYRVAFHAIGDLDPALGSPTQMVTLERGEP